MKTRVLVLGAGFGGLELTTLLSESLGDTVDVTLVVALGADYDLDAAPGLAEGGNEFYSVAGAARFPTTSSWASRSTAFRTS